MSSTETEGSPDASLKEVQIQMSNQKSTMANSLDHDNAITHEPVRKCLFCGHALNKRSKIAMSLSSVALIIIGVIIIVALFGPMMEDDYSGPVACRYHEYEYKSNGNEYESSGNGIDSAEVELVDAVGLCSSSAYHFCTYIWYICIYLQIIY